MPIIPPFTNLIYPSAALMPAAVAGPGDATSNLIHRWALNNTGVVDGGTFPDTGSSPNNGTAHGFVQTHILGGPLAGGTTAQNYAGFVMPGGTAQNARIQTASNFNWSTGGSFSVGGWVKLNDNTKTTGPTGGTGRQHFFVDDVDGAGTNFLRMQNDTNITPGSFAVVCCGSGVGTTAGLLTSGIWHHVMYVNSGGGAGGGKSLYVDNVLISATSTSSGGSPAPGTGGGCLGSFNYTDGSFASLDGGLYKWSVYARALNAADINVLYTQDTPPTGDTTTGLIAWWPLDDFGSNGASTGAFREIKNGFAGTLQTTGASFVNFGAYNFRNVNQDFMTVADQTVFNVGTAMAAFCWINCAPTSGGGFTPFCQYDSPAGARAWRLDSNTTTPYNKLRGLISSDGSYSSTTAKDYVSSITCFDSTWHSIGIRFGGGVFDLFIDGTKDPSPNKTAMDAPITTIFNTTVPLMVAGNVQTGSPIQSFDGLIQGCRLYNIAPSDANMTAIHALGRF